MIYKFHLLIQLCSRFYLKQNRELFGEQVPLGWKVDCDAELVNEKFTNHFFSLLDIPPGDFGLEILLRYAT